MNAASDCYCSCFGRPQFYVHGSACGRVHPKVVSDMLGHGSVGLTLDTYSHLLPAMHQQADAAMDAILAG